MIIKTNCKVIIKKGVFLMAVKIRLSRVGTTNAPMYRVVAIDERRKRDGKALEILGTYNPKTGELVQYHNDRVQKWIDQGAIMTDAVKKLQKKHNKANSDTQVAA